VLDNFEQVTAAGWPFVRDLLERVPTLTCLVTSRIRLGLAAEQVWDVRPLPVPDGSDATDIVAEAPSVQLFVDRARRRRPEFKLDAHNTMAVGELCRRLDGLPLGIELAAGWAKLLTPAQMLTRLRQVLVTRDEDVPDHHRSLDAALDISFRLLDPEVARLFARLSVLRGGWTLEQAEAVCAEPDESLLTALERLDADSLITAEERAGEMRYRMLETVRTYAEDRLRASGDEGRLREGHRAFFLGLAAEASSGLHGAGLADWLDRLEAEHQNLHAALSDASAPERVAAVTGLHRFWETHGHLPEGQRWLRDDLTGAADLPASVRREALFVATELENDASEYASALDYAREGLRLCDTDGDRARFLKIEAASLHYLRRDAEALSTAEQACATAESAWGSDNSEMADYHNLLGVILKMQGNRQAARPHYERALALAERDYARNPEWESSCRANLGSLLEEEGDLTAALTYLWSALHIDREIFGRHHPKAAIRHNSIGRVWAKRGNGQNAVRHHRRALDIYRETYSHPHIDIGMSRFYLANALLDLGQKAEAREQYVECLPILERHFGREHRWCLEVRKKIRGL
jgi:predicted ATPase/tetratricopeptide (TPR) repeat protein